MQTPQQIISESIKEICEKSRIGKKIFSTIVENIKQLNNLTEEQQKIVDEMQELVVEGTIKKNVVERLKILNQDFQDKIINMVTVQQYTHIVGEVEKTNIIKIFDIEAGYEFSEKKPMVGISYDEPKHRYKTMINGKTIQMKELNTICDMKKQSLLTGTENGLSVTEICHVFKTVSKYNNENIISFWTNTNNEITPYFDIMHIFKLINVNDRQKRRIKTSITQIYYYFEKNEFGGYIHREMIDEKTMYKIVLDSRSDFSKTFKDDISQLLIDLRKSGQIQITSNIQPQIQQQILTLPPINTQRRKTIQREILGYDACDMLPRLELCINEISCIYLFVIGHVSKLRESMKISDDIQDGRFVIKYGLTNNLARRIDEHMRTFNSVDGSELKLKFYIEMNEEYLPEAEKEIENYLDTLNVRIKWRDMVELATLTVPEFDALRQQYYNIGKIRNGQLKDITKQYEDKIRDINHLMEITQLKMGHLDELLTLEKEKNEMIQIDSLGKGIKKYITVKRWYKKHGDKSKTISEQYDMFKEGHKSVKEHEFKYVMNNFIYKK